MGWFRSLSLLAKILTVVGALAAVGGGLMAVYAWIEHQGYERGYAKARAQCEQEKADQRAANRKAIDEANKALMRAADDLSMKQLEIEDDLSQLDAAAAADPDAARACLGADSVRRLQTIR